MLDLSALYHFPVSSSHQNIALTSFYNVLKSSAFSTLKAYFTGCVCLSERSVVVSALAVVVVLGPPSLNFLSIEYILSRESNKVTRLSLIKKDSLYK
jgi:hypothetical protein